VWLVSIRPRELAAARGGPVPYRDAQRFRRWVILLATVPLLANIWIRERLDPAFASAWQFPIPSVDLEHDPMGSSFWQFNLLRQIGANLPGAMPMAVLLLITIATACTDLLFRVRSMSSNEANRAVVAGVYTCAPLAWIGLAAMINGADAIIEWTQSPTLLGVQLWLEVISGSMAPAAILLYFLATARALSATRSPASRENRRTIRR
jgi:hypothetical protein